jgi:hypothetical protein
MIINPDHGVAPTGLRVSRICLMFIARSHHCTNRFCVSPFMAHEASSYMIRGVFMEAKFESSSSWPMEFIQIS